MAAILSVKTVVKAVQAITIAFVAKTLTLTHTACPSVQMELFQLSTTLVTDVIENAEPVTEKVQVQNNFYTPANHTLLARVSITHWRYEA